MTRALAHRGPDGEGHYRDTTVALGHRRLAIIDPTGGAQPLADVSGRYVLVYNGEVYNYVELREELELRGCHLRTRCDAEVVLQSFIRDGAGAWEKFDGMFALGLWDRQERQLHLVRDRFGIKPLYYFCRGAEVVFASELKAILRHPLVTRSISALSVSKYFSYGYVPAPHTIFEGICKLEPGDWLRFDERGVRRESFAKLPLTDSPVVAGTLDDRCDEVLRLMRDAVRRQLRSDVPVGVFLSGGIDSSTVAALAAQESSGRVRSFSIGFDQSSYDESPYARRVASFIGTEHHEARLTLREAAELFPRVTQAMDEPFADPSVVPTYRLSELASGSVKVVLGGDGGDELFAGYPAFQAHKLVERLSFLPVGWRDCLGRLARRLPVSHRYASADFLMQQFLKGLGQSPEIRFVLWLGCYGNLEKQQLFSADLRHRLVGEDPFEDVLRHIEHSRLAEDLQRLQYLCIKLYFQDDILTKMDRASMANSLEVRVPYMDRALVDYSCRIQPRDKLRGLTTKFVFKRAVRELLPADIVHRRKAGFMLPVARWLTHELRHIVEDLCCARAVGSSGFFDVAFVRRMLDEHFERRRDHRRHIYPLVCFMAWLRKYGT